ncbi:PREDICTED: trihelix transcription factor GTL2-like isoform X2 [Ipomoea nil]|uniref:trihelix transcription factor GTL2-like isoform X2 n=1 Tax=Ipomoea nil TaxID=35883 RepID=UPI00090191FC|nr:PREDICTED: trihelix transcription factor GTL2-like isoform X2 [Ipomoea nil]
MFDGVPDQFHHFIASSRVSLQIPFPFPLHATTSPPPPPPPQPPPPPAPTFSTFDPYPSHQTLQPHHQHHQHQHQHHHLHHHLSPPPPQPKNEASKEDQTTTLLSTSLVLERERSSASAAAGGEPGGPWSNEEVLALLRIRSSMEINWFPDYSWEHVSRKLAELGFKRSPEKCKERFEEESRNLNSLSFNKSSFRFFSELDELYQHQGGEGDHHKNYQNEESVQTRNDNHHQQPPHRRERESAAAAAAEAQSLEEGSGNVDHNSTTSRSSKSNNNNGGGDENKKRMKRKGKRKRELEMFKGFCEGIVERIMAQQEEMHSKIIEDMVKREEEKIARDEAWKSQERERLNKEIETREKEHEIASNRQAKIIEFLNKFASSSSTPSLHSPLDQSLLDKINDLFHHPKNHPTSPSSTHPHNDEKMGTKKAKKVSSFPHQNPTSNNNPTPQSSTNPSFTSPKVPTETLILPSTTTMDLGDPEENHPTPQSKDTQNGGGDIGKRWPREEVLALINLRCNSLNNNKKRSVDSRTCPYFHQLSSLYCSQGKLRGDSPENRSSAD